MSPLRNTKGFCNFLVSRWEEINFRLKTSGLYRDAEEVKVSLHSATPFLDINCTASLQILVPAIQSTRGGGPSAGCSGQTEKSANEHPRRCFKHLRQASSTSLGHYAGVHLVTPSCPVHVTLIKFKNSSCHLTTRAQKMYFPSLS
jgi:hypothetical protein